MVFPAELVRLLDRLEEEIRADRVSSESRAWLAQCGLTVEQLARQVEPEYTPARKAHLYHCDHRGLPLALISEDGNTAWSAEYDEWGNQLNEENPHHVYQPYRLPGQQHDEESGLYYNRHRYYDRKRLVRTVLIFTESSDQLSRATDRVPGLPASPGYVQ
ncbi:RhsD protein [Escherichia coli]|nr:RhsD protein [Escherichia coli]